MPVPAILGSARLANFRLGYVPAATAAIRETRVIVTIGGELVNYRRGSVTIRDAANDAPNTCRLTLINPDLEPVGSQRIRVTINSDDPRLLFAGALESVSNSYVLKPDQLLYDCTAQDDTPRANRRIPLAYYADTPADEVAVDLIGRFAPGFTTANVQTGLPRITVHYEGSEAGLGGCLRQIDKLIGGYHYFEDRDLHLFLEESADAPDTLDSTPGRILDEPHIRITFDDSQLRTKVFGKGHAEFTQAEIAIGGVTIPIGDVSMYNPLGGQVISESQILDYTGTLIGGAGALVGTTITPTNGPTLDGRAVAGMLAGTRDWAVTFTTGSGDTLPGPRTSYAVGQALPPPSSAPAVARTSGGSKTAGVHKWKVSYVTATGQTLASLESAPLTMEDLAAPASIGTASVTPGNVLDANETYSYVSTFMNGILETLPSAPSNTFFSTGTNKNGKLTKAGNPVPPFGYWLQFYRTEGNGSVYKRMPTSPGGFDLEDATYYYDGRNDGQLLSVAAPVVNTAVYRAAILTIPYLNHPDITHVRIFCTEAGGSIFKTVADVVQGTTSYTDTMADGSLGAAEPSTPTAILSSVDLSAIPIGPSGTTGRKVWRSTFFGGPLKLLTTIANNTTTTYTDSTGDASLGADIHTTDTSGLVAQTGEVAAGSTSLLVTATPFPTGGGWVSIGAMTVAYTGISGSSLTGIPAAGAGSLTTSIRYGAEVVVASMLTGVSGVIRPLLKGAPIHIWVMEEDLDAQAALAVREGEGDGIIEHRIVDERRGEESLRALCRADLAQFSRPLVTVSGACRDVKMKSGKPLTVDLTSPFIDEVLTVQDVTIDQIDISAGLPPRFTFTASSLRFSVEDLLRRMASTLEGV